MALNPVRGDAQAGLRQTVMVQQVCRLGALMRAMHESGFDKWPTK